jgi:polyisoprenoid-binding protein YceI
MYLVRGKLTIKGITNDIEFPAAIYMQKGELHAKATFDLDRTKWDIRYGSNKFFDNLANNVIDDMFTVSFDLTAQTSRWE